jgi:hypothetical protein
MKFNKDYRQMAIKAQKQIQKLECVGTNKEKNILKRFIRPIAQNDIERLERLDKKILGGEKNILFYQLKKDIIYRKDLNPSDQIVLVVIIEEQKRCPEQIWISEMVPI